jgi:hypothetical protein
MIVEREILADLGMTEIVPAPENRFFKIVEQSLDFALVRECIELGTILDAELDASLLSMFDDRNQPIPNPGIHVGLFAFLQGA